MSRQITALSPWMGSNRMLGAKAGELMGKRRWIGIPFAGGMAELRYMDAPTMLVSDLHRHIINLANMVKTRRQELQEACDLLFHPENLGMAQARCIAREEQTGAIAPFDYLQWAADFFVCSWMAQSSRAGTKNEFKASLATRWTANGGDSAKRYRGAIEALAEWEQVAKRCTFVCMDVIPFLARALQQDQPGHGLYLDPPFPDTGDDYKHTMTPGEHERMAGELLLFKDTRIVLRFYDHPAVRELYHERCGWTWHRLSGGRNQANNADTPELLLTRN